MKATKATVTIFSALASVIILTSCAPKPTENKTTESGTSDKKISIERKYHVYSLVSKGG